MLDVIAIIALLSTPRIFMFVVENQAADPTVSHHRGRRLSYVGALKKGRQFRGTVHYLSAAARVKTFADV